MRSNPKRCCSSLVHATCIALDGRAALLMGPSGAGKSDLALRCIGLNHNLAGCAHQAVLVADDRVILERSGSGVIARPPPAIAGKLEVRGLGVVDLPAASEARLTLLVELVDPGEIERLPDPAPEVEIMGLQWPVLRVAPFQASAPLKVLLRLVAGD